MKRRLLNVLTALSLLLCVAILALWVRSYWRSDFLGYSKLQRRGQMLRVPEIGVATFRGGAVLDVTDQTFSIELDESVEGIPLGWSYSSRQAEDPGGYLFASWGGFGYEVVEGAEVSPRVGWNRTVTLGFPMWPLTLLFGLLPAVRLYRRLRPKSEPGHCRGCGYDLTGTQSGTCPECGTVVPARPKA